MARSPAAVNGGWPPQRHPAEHDPRSARPAPAGQRPAPGQPAGYPAHPGYPDPQAPAYDPQGYHFPQQQPAPQQHGHPGAPQGNPRQGLSSLDSAAQQGGDYRGFPSAPAGYGQPQQPQGFPSPNSHDPRTMAPQGAPQNYRQAPAPFGGQPQPGQPQQPGQPNGLNGLGDMRGGAPSYDQWQSLAPQPQEQNPYDLGGYLPNQPAAPTHDQGEWGHAAEFGYAEPEDHYQPDQLGYDQPHGGALEQAYGHEEAGEYELEEPRRGSWAMRIAGAVVVAIGLGYGLAQGYKLISGSGPDGAPPIVKGDSEPARTKPADPGGKQFAHTDSKVMGRLGDGASRESSNGSLASDADAGGTRRVQTLTVGRDGSIAAPSGAEDSVGSTGTVAVPGLTVVDGFGGGFPGASPSPPQESAPAPRQPVVISPPAESAKPVNVAAVTPAASSPPPMPKKSAPAAKKTAAAATSAPSGANGYVAVLASVPASGGSRLLALRKFADMQQQYGSVLQNKTPDVREANLGERGTYHRLLVGPPGSRAQASSVCSQLKSAGYKDCWVTAY